MFYNIITTQNWRVTFEGPSLIFFIWSLYLISSASSLAIFFSMDSERASTCVWTSGMSLCFQADNTALKCRLCACMCGMFMCGTKQSSPQRYYGLWFINTSHISNLVIYNIGDVMESLKCSLMLNTWLGDLLCVGSVIAPLYQTWHKHKQHFSAGIYSHFRYSPINSEEAFLALSDRIFCSFLNVSAHQNFPLKTEKRHRDAKGFNNCRDPEVPFRRKRIWLVAVNSCCQSTF